MFSKFSVFECFSIISKTMNDQNDDNNNDHYERMMKRKVNERLNEVLKRNNMCLIDSEGMSEQYQHVSQKKKNHLQLFPSLPWMVVYVNDLPRGALVEIHSFAWMKKLQLPSDDDDDDEEMEQQWNDLPSLVLKEDVSLMSSLSNVQTEKQYGELRATNIRVLRLSPHLPLRLF
ncbi:hypothetical protein C9374_002124 [Naegleria lovaniensis]|uniref:Uncharacterized protein n=1 Tax=Naegleria lovaniensis TaxID=51637 RepID=A0AA88GVV8_NAELO|nr:uncharacterized protein C9374_002124 [Naegleria lovaniensis]KAG2387089.1 hypothetical protein C9374_002124 [Naegleria lovaniensis]